MSLKNFMSYEDASTVLGEYADKVNELKSGLTNVDVALSVPDGAGKNKLPMTVDSIKAANTDGTWSGNTYTLNNVTFDLQTDDGENITGIKVNGTANAVTSFFVTGYGKFLTAGTNYALNGCMGGAGDTYKLDLLTSTVAITTSTTGDGDHTPFTITNSVDYRARITVYSGVNVSNQMFYPMIRPATITDPTFAPYIPSVESRIEAVESDSVKLFENICSGVKIKRGYKGYDADVITFDNGYYIFIVVKPLYGNSAIYAIDGSSTPQLLGGKDLSITQTVNNSRISLSFVGNYMQFMLVRLNTKADFTDEIHLTVATP